MPQITQIQVRRDAAATWTSTNPTLAEGEIGFETDTGKFKIGTKVATVLQTWTQLPYATDASDITGTTLSTSVTTATGLTSIGTLGSLNVTNTVAAGTLTGSGTGITALNGSNVSTGTVGILYGGTGATTAALARTALGVAASGANSDITSLSALSTPLSAGQGGTGSTIGSPVVGRAILMADRVKAANTSTPEAVFWDSAATAPQYINLEANTLYSFDGYVQIDKGTATSSLISASMLYYTQGAGTTTQTAASATFQGTVHFNSGSVGLITTATTNSNAVSGGSANSTAVHHVRFSGQIQTNSNSGKFTVAVGTNTGLAAAPTYKAGSAFTIYKHGASSVVNFGNWSA